ncbi:Nse1 non-SMC component of SMC5-6 complex-domain-containing protein [Cyathus striatus]|nr:Nse1 non-SMC component of SMC5-6 complex-domain-containing protein [Cyathus striatus]
MPVSSKDADRLFLQAILSRSVVTFDVAKALWEKAVEAVKASNDAVDVSYSNDRDSWDEFIARINKSLDKLDLEFRHLHDESTGKEMYALVNRKGDEIAQMATDYTPAEIAFFKAIVEQIILAPRESFSVSSLIALREIGSIKPKVNMSKSQAEVVLGSFVARGWLLKSKRGRYSLSTRSILELQPFLKSTYPDEILECTICFEILTRGIACHTPNCKTRMHFHCFSNYRRRHGVCPSCGKDWPREAKDKPLIPVGEDAVKDGDEGKRRVRIRSADPSDDDNGEEDELPSQSQEDFNAKRHRKTEMNENNMDIGSVNDTQEHRATRRSHRVTRR